jgi:hypothetical protein
VREHRRAEQLDAMIDSASGVFDDAAKTAARPTPAPSAIGEAEQPREHAAERGADEEQRRDLSAEEARAQGHAVKSSFSANA